MHPSPTAEEPGRHVMQCMEIWGGSHAVVSAVTTPGLDGWISSLPHEGAEAGGDVHYVSLCGGGLLTRAIVADVSGHGASVAAFSRSLRDLMRRNINRKGQERLVGALNRQFAELAGLRRFATAVVVTFLAHRDRLIVCNAGHPRPLFYRAAAGEWALMTSEGEADAGNLPLGIDDATAYEGFSTTLAPGDLVLLYTDALIEAADPSGRMLGESGLLDLARGLDAGDPRAIGPALLEAVARHRAGGPADDDVTLLVLRHVGGGPKRLGLRDKLDVYAKVFGLKAV